MTIRNQRTPPPSTTRSGATPITPGSTSTKKPGSSTAGNAAGKPARPSQTRAPDASGAVRGAGTGVSAVKDQVDANGSGSAPRDTAADDGDLNAAMARATTPGGKLRRSKAPPHVSKSNSTTSNTSSRGSTSGGGARASSVGRSSSASRRGGARGRGGGDEHVDGTRSLKSVHGAEGNKEDPGADRGRKGHSASALPERSDWRMKVPLPSPRPATGPARTAAPAGPAARAAPSPRPAASSARASAAESRLRGQLTDQLGRNPPAAPARRSPSGAAPAASASADSGPVSREAPARASERSGPRHADIAREMHEEELRVGAGAGAGAALAGAAGAAALAAAWDDEEGAVPGASSPEELIAELRGADGGSQPDTPGFPARLEAEFHAAAQDVPRGDLLEVAARAEADATGVSLGLAEEFQPLPATGGRETGDAPESPAIPAEGREERDGGAGHDGPQAVMSRDAPASAAEAAAEIPAQAPADGGGAARAHPVDDGPWLGGDGAIGGAVDGGVDGGVEGAADQYVEASAGRDSSPAPAGVFTDDERGRYDGASAPADTREGLPAEGAAMPEGERRVSVGDDLSGYERPGLERVGFDRVDPESGVALMPPAGDLDRPAEGFALEGGVEVPDEDDLGIPGVSERAAPEASAAEDPPPRGLDVGDGASRLAAPGGEGEIAPPWLPGSASELGGDLHAVDLAQQEVDAEDAISAAAAEARSGRAAAPAAESFDDFASVMFEDGAGIDGVLLSPEQRTRAADYGIPFVQGGELVAGNPALVRAELNDMAAVLAGLKVDVSDITSGLQTLLDSDGGGDEGGGEGEAEGEADGDD